MDLIRFLKWALLGFTAVLIVYFSLVRGFHVLETSGNFGWEYALVGALVVLYLGYRLGTRGQ